jgi:hypothetical protein
MTKEKRDLLIHYDEESQKVIFYTVRTSETAGIRQHSFDGVCPDVEFLKSMPAEEAEMKLGGLVFSIIDLSSTRKIGIRPYEAEAEELHTRFVAELEEQVKSADPDAQYQLFIHLHSLAMRNYSLPELARAEALLQAAAAQGHEEALSSLDSWPMLKAAAERRINRGPAA